jgi:hypothetical protein
MSKSDFINFEFETPRSCCSGEKCLSVASETRDEKRLVVRSSTTLQISHAHIVHAVITLVVCFSAPRRRDPSTAETASRARALPCKGLERVKGFGLDRSSCVL